MAKTDNPSGRKRLYLLLAIVIAAGILLTAFFSKRRSVPVRAVTATRGPITSSISTNGKIEAMDNFEAHAPAPTTVRKVLVKEGDHVRAGQMLLQLDDAAARAEAARANAQHRAAQADLAAVRQGGTREEVLTNQAQLSKARTAVDAARRNLEAMQRLQAKGAASPEEVRAAQENLGRAQADLDLLQQKVTNRYSGPEVERVQASAREANAALEAAEELLRKSNVRAVRDGVVYSLPVRQGQFVNAGDLLVAVADLSSVQVRAFVDEPEIGRLRKGLAVMVTWDAIPGRQWQGTLKSLPATVVQRGTRNVGEVVCAVDNADHALLPNVNVNVTIVVARNENALTLPREAVHQDADGKRFVYQIVKDELQRREIETAISNLTQIEITQGLSENAEIALSATNNKPLKPGLEVRIAGR